jgi:hypothetical protein
MLKSKITSRLVRVVHSKQLLATQLILHNPQKTIQPISRIRRLGKSALPEQINQLKECWSRNLSLLGLNSSHPTSIDLKCIVRSS